MPTDLRPSHLRAALEGLRGLISHSGFDHEYERDEWKCPACRTLKAADTALVASSSVEALAWTLVEAVESFHRSHYWHWNSTDLAKRNAEICQEPPCVAAGTLRAAMEGR